MDGFWRKTFPIEGGAVTTAFTPSGRHVENVPLPRRYAFAKIYWFDDNSKPMEDDTPVTTAFLNGSVPVTGPEFPSDRESDAEVGPCSKPLIACRPGRRGHRWTCTSAGLRAARSPGATSR